MDAEIRTVDEWIAEFVADLESEVDEVGEVLTWYQVAVFVNDMFEYSIFQGYVDTNDVWEVNTTDGQQLDIHVNPETFSELRGRGLDDATEDDFIARLDSYDKKYGHGTYSIAEGFLDQEYIEDDYEERLASKPARIARALEWYPRPNSFSEHEYTGDIYLELV